MEEGPWRLKVVVMEGRVPDIVREISGVFGV